MLATLTPSEYVKFRGVLGAASGFQSLQYRIIEFLLGNKNREHARRSSRHDAGRPGAPARGARGAERCTTSSCATSPAAATRCRPTAWSATSPSPTAAARTCCPSSRRSTTRPKRDWEAYELCEELVDVEESFQLWRFRHMKTVERIIGYKRGTGGSSGVGFLRAALDLTFFPELLDVRTEIGA